jgi:hypothetical protein
MKKTSFFLSIFLFSSSLAAESNPEDRKKRLEPSGELSWESYAPGLWVTFRKEPLPKDLLLKLERAILFAFREGAARVISLADLDHAHLLFWPEKKEIATSTVDALLLHSQEAVRYSAELYKKRNIFFGPDGTLRILSCLMRDNYCTVTAQDLRMKDLIPVYFVRVRHLPPKELAGYESNIRIIRGEKILFGIVDFKWDGVP